MKILDILPYIPYPLNSGGNQAVFNMLAEMVKEHEVHILLRAKTDKDKDNIAKLLKELPALTIHTCDERQKLKDDASLEAGENGVKYTFSMRIFDYFRKSMERKIERRRVKILNKMMRYAPKAGRDGYDKGNDNGEMIRYFTTLYNFQPEHPTKYKQFVYETSRLGFDIVQCEFYETLGLVSLLPSDVKKVFVHHELRYVRNANEMELFNEITPTDIYTYHQLKDAEIAALRHFDTVVTLTDIDKELLSKEDAALNIYVSPAIVKYDAQSCKYKELVNEMVFVGSADHFPNYDGLAWYCKNVAPELRKRGKEPLLYVTGKWQEDKRYTIESTGANVKFAGFVENLHEFLNGRLSIVPIRIGSGMRMKILDAIDSASPIVSTSKGCEGLAFKDGVDMFICDTPKDFAVKILDVLNDVAVQKKLVENGKEKLHKAFTPERQIETRLRLYSSLK